MFNIQPGIGLAFSGSREIALGLGPLIFFPRIRVSGIEYTLPILRLHYDILRSA